MTRPRHRRPTFSATSPGDSRRFASAYESDEDSARSDNELMNHRRGSSSRFTPSTFVERWIRRSSTANQAEQPMLSGSGIGDSDDDFGVGIPMDDDPPDDRTSLRSKPSTRRSSVDSSIDDVCMPLDDEETYTGSHSGIWPDLPTLEEYAKKEAAEQASAEAAQLVRESVNEAAEATRQGRLRPERSIPWTRQNTYRARTNMRYTYFRDDLPATVHSPSIIGLLQPGQSFADLFPPQPEQRRPSDAVSSTRRTHTHGGPPGLAPPNPAPTQQVQSAAAQPAPPGVVLNHPVPTSAAATPLQKTMPATGYASSAEKVASPVPPSAGKSSRSASRSRSPGARSHFGVTSSPHSQVGAQLSSQAEARLLQEIDPGPVEEFPGISPDPETAQNLKGKLSSHNSVVNDERGPWWLDIYAPTEEEMRVISRTFGIHPLTTEDIVLHETREKVELFHNYYFVCFTSFDVESFEKGDKKKKNEDNGHSKPTTDERSRRGSVSQRSTSSRTSLNRRRRVERLKPLAVFQIVFPSGIITVHYRPTPHTINVRRRIRLLRDYLNVSSDWISYALVDDITDAYQPLITAVDEDVQAIEDAILNMHGSNSDSEDDDSDNDEKQSVASTKTGTTSTGYREWRKKGNMLRWIGETRKRVMSLLSLLGNKADVIKGFAKRVSEHWSGGPNSEIALYLSDIQDHIVTMTQSLNHYEKLLARSHSNYLAQINIDMTRTNNEMNDVLSKISVLGTIVLPMNIITGLWGMNVIVPGQFNESLIWFWGILAMMILFGVSAYFVLIRFV